MAKEYGIDIRLYTIIYKLVEEMELALQGMLAPEFEEKVLGTCEVRQLFRFSKIGNIAELVKEITKRHLSILKLLQKQQ